MRVVAAALTLGVAAGFVAPQRTASHAVCAVSLSNEGQTESLQDQFYRWQDGLIQRLEQRLEAATVAPVAVEEPDAVAAAVEAIEEALTTVEDVAPGDVEAAEARYSKKKKKKKKKKKRRRRRGSNSSAASSDARPERVPEAPGTTRQPPRRRAARHVHIIHSPPNMPRARDSKSSEPVSKGAESASARTPPKPPADADDPDHYLSPSRAEQQALSARKRRESEERLQSVVAGRVAAEALNRSAAIQRPKLKKRESLEGLHGTGRVSQLRDSHAETWRASEKARADDELATSLRGTGRVSRLGAAHMANWAKGESLGPGQGRGRSSNVDSIVSLFESAVQRHRDTKAVALSTKPRTRNSVKLVATMPTPLADAIALAKAQEWAVDDALADAPKPMFANVSDSAFKLVVQIAAADPERHHLEFCVLSNGCRDEPEWESVDAPTVCLEITEPGTHMIVSRSVDKVTRQVMTLPAHAVFETALPDVVKSAAHEHTLELVEPPSHEPICDGCTKQIPNGASHYKCNEQACGAFALCIDCALAVGPAGSGALAGEAKKEKRRSSVALSVGAKRLWLSEDVAFGGSSEAISDASLELVDQIAAVLCAHPHLDGIIIEGHTNSKCGLECDGSMQCSNNTCHRHFGANGGAVAFSLRRADAVKAALVARGVDADRLVARGLAGQRRLVDDTEAEDNHRNRRVEVHLHDADDDDEDDFEVAGKLVDLKLEEGAEYDDDDAEYDDDEGAEYDNEGAEYDEGAENELPQDEAGPMHDEAAEYEDEPPPPAVNTDKPVVANMDDLPPPVINMDDL